MAIDRKIQEGHGNAKANGAESSPAPSGIERSTEKLAHYTLILAIGTCVLGLAAILQLAEMRTEQRPWIGIVGIENIKGPEHVGDNIKFFPSFTFKNYGRSPAIVYVEAAVIWDSEEVIWDSRQKKACSTAHQHVSKEGWGKQWTVLPNTKWPYYLADKPILLEPPVPELQRKLGNDKTYKPIIVGCVIYRSTTDLEKRKTAFVGSFSFEDPDAHLARDDITGLPIDLKPDPPRQVLVKAISINGESD